ncbi:MAG: hypothetical protein Q4E53_10185 [Eubacteriales bacterium]|nr:hypothetical protein [Eubacteriales bacterium]
MKKLNKILLSVIAVFALAVFVKLPVDAAAKQTACTQTSVTIQWDLPYYATSSYYTVTGYGFSTSASITPTSFTQNDPYRTSGTFSLPTNYSGYVYIFCSYYRNSDPYKTLESDWFTSTYVNTLPATAATNNFAVDSVLYNTKKVSFKVSQNPSASGFQLELYKNGQFATRQAFYGSSSTYLPVAANIMYQYRVRYYIKNSSNGQTYYSASWSPMRKFCLAKYSGKAKSNKKGFSLTLKKATGVSKYLIYVSKKSSSTGFKKIASVSLGKKSKKTIQIVKGYKKKATNYIRIIPVFKDGSKSDIISTGSIYVYK